MTGAVKPVFQPVRTCRGVLDDSVWNSKPVCNLCDGVLQSFQGMATGGGAMTDVMYGSLMHALARDPKGRAGVLDMLQQAKQEGIQANTIMYNEVRTRTLGLFLLGFMALGVGLASTLCTGQFQAFLSCLCP